MRAKASTSVPHRMARLATTTSIALLMVSGDPVAGAETAWTGAVDSDWTNAGNWNNGVPTADSTTTIGGPPQTVLTGTGATDPLSILSGGSLAIDGGNLTAMNNVFLGGGALVIRNGGLLNIFFGFGSVVGVGGGSLIVESGGVIEAGSIDSSSVTFNNGTFRAGFPGQVLKSPGGVTLTGAGLILETDVSTEIHDNLTGNGALTKTGTGTIVLSGVKTYSGGTFLNNGMVSVVGDSNLGAESGNLTFDGGTLLITGQAFSTRRNVSLSAGGGTILPDSPFAVASLNGNISGVGALTKTGPGALELGGTNTYTGGTVIKSGELRVESDDKLGAATGNIVFDGGTLLTNTISFTTHRDVALLSGGGTILPGDTFGTATFNGNISGVGALTKTETGTLELAGVNTYTGGTVVNGGTLSQNSATALPTDTPVTVNNGGLVLNFDFTASRLSGTGGAVTIENGVTLTVNQAAVTTFSGAISGAGALTKTSAGWLELNGTNTYTGGTTVLNGQLRIGNGGTSTASILGDVTNHATLAFNRADDYTFGGVISGSGGVVHDGNILRFTSAQTYAGPTVVNYGILVLTTEADFGLASTSLVTLGTGAALDISNRAQRIAGLSGNGSVYSFGGGSGRLSLEVGGSQTHEFSGNLGGAHPNFSLTKDGAGTQILSGNNTYTGETLVNAGTLLIDGTLGAGRVTVASGATLGGHGSIQGDLHFGGDSYFLFDSLEELDIEGAVTFDGFGIGNLIGLDPSTAPGTYTLLGGPANFNFSNVANFGLENAYDLGQGKLAYFQAGSLQLVVIPEPSRPALILLVLLGGLLFRRKFSCAG